MLTSPNQKRRGRPPKSLTASADVPVLKNSVESRNNILQPSHEEEVLVIGDIARIEGETNAEYVLRAEKLLDGKRLADLDKAALAALEEVLSATEAPAAVVAAAREILQRTRGKPVERIEMSGPNGGPIATVAVSDEQLARFVKRHAQKNEANREET